MYNNIECNVSQKCQRQIFLRPTRSSRNRLIRRVLFGNNGRRELKETPSSNRKIPCQEIMFSRLRGQILDAMRSERVAVAVERAQSLFDVVFSAVVALRRSSKTASSGMLLVNPFVSLIGGETHDDCFPIVVTHVALLITSLTRMLASITFALNERRNQNGNFGSKLLTTGEDPRLLIFQFLWRNHMDEPHRARCFSIFSPWCMCMNRVLGINCPYEYFLIVMQWWNGLGSLSIVESKRSPSREANQIDEMEDSAMATA
ncbi:hypothetical protein T07_3406 [Trichinella nelsoni]|uniref:Uncharacterized protein n=1 Tax=Trichinella nelsoni TaxID=6336 RepID=A0A0V0RDS1_9BILA|nr:hypothetical protein T07_3406 [Trichinella nelsoni]